MQYAKVKRSVAASLIFLLSLALCKAPAYAQFSKLSEQDELELGRQAAIQVERKYPVLRDPRVQSQINNLGQRLARQSSRRIPYHFRVLDIPDVNAFALPGGYIYMNRGVLNLARNESEVAGVLAHEISHVELRHSVEQLQRAQKIGLGLGILDMLLGRRGGVGQLADLAGQMVGQGVFMKFSRDAERAADREGVMIMARAGYDPRGMLTFLQRMEQIQKSNPNEVAGFLSSHPSLREREQNVADLIERTSPDTRTRRNRYRR